MSQLKIQRPAASRNFPFPSVHQATVYLIGIWVFWSVSLLGFVSEVRAHSSMGVFHIEAEKKVYARVFSGKVQKEEKNFFFFKPDNFFRASLKFDDNKYKIKIAPLWQKLEDIKNNSRLLFKIKLNKDQRILGLEQFVIQPINATILPEQWFFHEALRAEGLVGLKYEIINIVFNGNHLGRYILREAANGPSFEKEQGRTGLILNFDEDFFWKDFQRQNRQQSSKNRRESQLISVIKNWHLKQQYLNAVELMSSYRDGRLQFSEAFNVEKTAKFWALGRLFGVLNENFNSLRFFYDAETHLLEPSGFPFLNEGPVPKSGRASYSLEQNTFPYGLKGFPLEKRNHLLVEKYIGQLERVSEERYVTNLVNKLAGSIKKAVKTVDLKFPEGTVYKNAKIIRKRLSPVTPLYTYFVRGSGKELVLEFRNAFYYPIQIVSVALNNYKLSKPKNRLVLNPQKFDLTPFRFKLEPPEINFDFNGGLPENFKRFRFETPESVVWTDFKISRLKVNYKLLGHSKIKTSDVIPREALNDDLYNRARVKRVPNFRDFEFISVDETTRKITISAGKWDLSRNLIIPKGYKVSCQKGTIINLTQRAAFISHSPLNFIGSEDAPILIYSEDATGQGIAVIDAGPSSVFKHVEFNGLASPKQGSWKLTGAVTFYESDVDFINTRFINNHAEDGLNIIRSVFIMEDTLFQGNQYDSFDIDFSEGKIRRAKFINTGNDAIDMSGSKVTIEEVSIEGAGDKGISIGEESIVNAHDLDIKSSPMGIASKDLSFAQIETLKITNTIVGLAAYRKKPEYGPGNLVVQRLRLDGVLLPFHVEKDSKVVLDGTNMEISRIKTTKLLKKLERWVKGVRSR